MISFKIVLYKQKTYSEGQHPVMLQFVKERKVKRLVLNYKCIPKQWNQTDSRFKPSYPNYRLCNNYLKSIEAKVQKLIDSVNARGENLSIQSFIKEFKNPKSKVNFNQLMLLRMDELTIGNRAVYKSTLNSINAYAKKEIWFRDIDYEFLVGYESYLRKRGCKPGTMQVYMRTLRAIYNEAIRRKVVEQEFYPFNSQFSRNGYSIARLKSQPRSRALSESEIDKIKKFPFSLYPELALTVHVFLFSYYTNGMNFSDIARLSRKNIINNRIEYNRQKTGKPFSILITEPIDEILKSYIIKNPNYLFPILNESIHKEEIQIFYRIKKCLKRMNKELKKVAKILEIETLLTTYVARHTYATTLKRKGINENIISENLGHKNIQVTQLYLQQFSNSVLDEANKVL
jgi:integrase/recombinase XerD